MQKQIELKFQLTYLKNNLSECEINPELYCFLDSTFKRKVECVKLKKEGSVQDVSVKGFGTSYINSSLCFSSYSWRKNEFNSPGLMSAGVAHVTFGTLQKYPHIDLPLIMHTVGGLEKGVIRIKMIQNVPAQISAPIGIDINRDYTEHIGNYVETVMQMEQNMPERFNGTDRMRVPYSYNDAGFQSTKTPLPSIAYLITETPLVNEHYWENAFETVMKRDDLKPEQWHRLNKAGKARVACLITGFYSQYCDYTSDTVDRNVKGAPYDPQKVTPCEHFSSSLECRAGGIDCEDVSCGTLQLTNAFLAAKIDNSKPILKEAQSILSNYIVPISLDVVRGAQVSDKTENYGAHMNDNFIPIKTFQKWLCNTKEGREINKTLPWPKDAEKEEDLPFLVGEGTGLYEPLGYSNPLLPIMSYVYRAPSLEQFKKPILHPKGEPGSFFVGSLVGLTDFFYKKGADLPMGFWYCTKNNAEIQRGVSYTDMMNDHENIVVKIQPKPNKLVGEVIKDAVTRRLPPIDVILTPEKHVETKSSHLERLTQSINQLNRPQGPKHQYVPIYVRPHQLNSELVSQMINDMTHLNRVWKIDYDLEKIKDGMFGYRVRIFVK